MENSKSSALQESLAFSDSQSEKRYYALLYTCALIEQIGRDYRLRRSDVVKQLGVKTIKRIYTHSDVLHCESLEKNAYEFATRCALMAGDYDNISSCHYAVPDAYSIGKVYARLTEDIAGIDYGADAVIGALCSVYTSWIDSSISNYNTDFYYQNRNYIYECYKAGKVLV